MRLKRELWIIERKRAGHKRRWEMTVSTFETPAEAAGFWLRRWRAIAPADRFRVMRYVPVRKEARCD